MKRRILAMLLAVCVCAGIVVCPVAVENVVYAEERLQSGDFEYCIHEDGAVCITKYIGKETTVIIPDTLDGQDVTKITGCVFSGCSKVTSIQIPASVNEINNGKDFFRYNIGKIFEGCTSLNSITVDPRNQSYSSQDGLLYNYDKTILLCYPPGKTGEVKILDSVTNLDGAFLGCNNVTALRVPKGVEEIGRIEMATDPIVDNCDNLTCIEFQEGVTSIGMFSMTNCNKLSSIILPSSIECLSAIFGWMNNPNYSPNVKDIYYRGTLEQWEKIDMGLSDAGYFDNCTIHYNFDGSLEDIKINQDDNESDHNTNNLQLSKAVISAITNTANGIEITWNPVSNAAVYDIYRRIPNNAWAKIATVNSSITKYTDTAVKSKNGTMYGYKIQAVNQNVTGEYSNECTIYRLSSPQLKSVKNNKVKKVTAKWSKATKINGYEIQYSTSKNFKKATTKKVKSSKKSYVINKLKKKKTYYIRIRTYKKVNSTTYYSAWSPQKKVKIKK